MSTGEWSGYPNDAALTAPQDSGTDKRYLGGVRRGPTAPQDEAVEAMRERWKEAARREPVYQAAKAWRQTRGVKAQANAIRRLEQALEAYGDAREAKGRREALEEAQRVQQFAELRAKARYCDRCDMSLEEDLGDNPNGRYCKDCLMAQGLKS